MGMAYHIHVGRCRRELTRKRYLSSAVCQLSSLQRPSTFGSFSLRSSDPQIQLNGDVVVPYRLSLLCPTFTIQYKSYLVYASYKKTVHWRLRDQYWQYIARITKNRSKNLTHKTMKQLSIKIQVKKCVLRWRLKQRCQLSELILDL